MSIARLMQMARAGVPSGGGGSYSPPTGTILSSFASPSGLPFGLAYDGSNLISCDLGADRIYIHDGVSATVSSSYASPAANPAGLTYDGTNLISCDVTSDTIYVHDGTSSTILSSFAAPGASPQGLAYDGTNLISCDSSSDLIYIHDGVSATILSSFSAPSSNPRDLAFDGTNLISCDGGTDLIYVHDGVSSTVLSSFSSPSTNPEGLTHDGTNLISCDYNTDLIYIHANAAAPAEWTDPDLGNASYDSVSFSVAGQETTPSGFYIGDDGSKLYLSGGATDSIYQYTLTTPWDLSTASYDSVSLSVSSQDTQPNGITFKPDGTIMYVSGNAGNDINQYSLSTPWDLSSASFDSKTLSINSQDPTPRGLAFNTDGSILLVVGGSNDAIFQYTLTTPWDISTGSYASKSFDTTSQETGPYGIYLSPNEDKLWLIGFSADAVLQYSLTAADISTASYDSISFSVSSQETSPYTVFFKDDGSKMYVMGPTTDTIYQYSTA